VNRTDPWISRYIFPNSMLPLARQICTQSEGLFVLEDRQSFGADNGLCADATRASIQRYDELTQAAVMSTAV